MDSKCISQFLLFRSFLGSQFSLVVGVSALRRPVPGFSVNLEEVRGQRLGCSFLFRVLLRSRASKPRIPDF